MGALLAKIGMFFKSSAPVAGKVLVPAAAVGAGAATFTAVNKYKVPLLILGAGLIAWKLGVFKNGSK